MERRDFLKIAFGATAGMALAVTAARAAPLAPPPLPTREPPRTPELDAEPAVVTGDDIERVQVEQVRWHHRHWGWRHPHWGWRRRHWRRRYWRRRHYYY